MIVCSCNVLTDHQILSTLSTEETDRPRSPAQVYRCLGCKPNCGRCLVQVKKMLAEARVEGCNVGCAICPAGQVAADRGGEDPTPAPRPAYARSLPPSRRGSMPARPAQPPAAPDFTPALLAAE